MSTDLRKLSAVIMVIVLAGMLIACTRYETDLESARKLVDEGKYKEALAILEDLKKDFPYQEYEVSEIIRETSALHRKNTSKEASQKAYNDGMACLNDNDYVGAYDIFKRITKADEETYNAARAKMEEISDRTFEQLVDYAKRDAKNRLYDAAVKWARDARSIKSNDEIKELLAIYEEEADKAEAEARRKRIIESMEIYEKGSGDVGIACQTKKTTRFNTDFTTYTVKKGFIFLHVWVSALNYGSSSAHVNPTYITVSTKSGHTFNPHTETTYSLSNYFDAIDLPSEGISSGWLIFLVPDEDEYVLHYNDFFGSVDKELIVTE